jgi:N-acetylglutamate synthase-like GNAT family acetyltransferase
MQFRQIKLEDIDYIIEIFKQKSLLCADGKYVSKDWIECFINNGFAFCLEEQNEIKSALIAETILMNGVLLWMIAVKEELKGQGYGQKLLTFFECQMKESGKKWIFLNSTPDSKSFYRKNGFSTTDFSLVFEHIKEL